MMEKSNNMYSYNNNLVENEKEAEYNDDNL
jgi:hypothetical protein